MRFSRARSCGHRRRARRRGHARAPPACPRAGCRAATIRSPGCAADRAASAARLEAAHRLLVAGILGLEPLDDAAQRLRQAMTGKALPLGKAAGEHEAVAGFVPPGARCCSMISRARGGSGTTCGRRAFMRSAGISHRASRGSSSADQLGAAPCRRSRPAAARAGSAPQARPRCRLRARRRRAPARARAARRRAARASCRCPSLCGFFTPSIGVSRREARCRPPSRRACTRIERTRLRRNRGLLGDREQQPRRVLAGDQGGVARAPGRAHMGAQIELVVLPRGFPPLWRSARGRGRRARRR